KEGPFLSMHLRRILLVTIVASATVATAVVNIEVIRRIAAEQICPLPAAPAVVDDQIIITPDSVDGVINCETLDIIIGSTGEVIIERNVTDDDSLSGDWGATLKVQNL